VTCRRCSCDDLPSARRFGSSPNSLSTRAPRAIPSPGRERMIWRPGAGQAVDEFGLEPWRSGSAARAMIATDAAAGAPMASAMASAGSQVFGSQRRSDLRT
jgi:hypothetical protein